MCRRNTRFLAQIAVERVFIRHEPNFHIEGKRNEIELSDHIGSFDGLIPMTQLGAFAAFHYLLSCQGQSSTNIYCIVLLSVRTLSLSQRD